MKINLYILLVVGLAQGSFLNCMDAGSANVQALSAGAPVVSAWPDSQNNTKDLEQKKEVQLIELMNGYMDGKEEYKQKIIRALESGVNVNLKISIRCDNPSCLDLHQISCNDVIKEMSKSLQMFQQMQLLSGGNFNAVLDQMPQSTLSQMGSAMGFNSIEEMKVNLSQMQKSMENGAAQRAVELQELFAHYENKEFGEHDSDEEILNSVPDTLDDEADSSATASTDKPGATRVEKRSQNSKKENTKKSGWFSWLTPKRVAFVGVTAVAAYFAKNYFFAAEEKKNK